MEKWAAILSSYFSYEAYSCLDVWYGIGLSANAAFAVRAVKAVASEIDATTIHTPKD